MIENKIYISREKLRSVVSNLEDNNIKDLLELREVGSEAINYYLEQIGSKYLLEKTESLVAKGSQPLVSFLMTTWNRRDLLEKTMDSIFSLDYSNFQFVIVDDNSTDNTEEYILALQAEHPETEIVFIKTSGKKGPGLNKRLGFDKVKGDYIIFIDDDDFYIDPHWIKNAISIFKDNPQIASVWFNSLQLHMNSNKLLFPKNTQMSLYGLKDSASVLKGFQTDIHKPQSTFPVIYDTKKYKEAGAEEMKILNDTSIYLRGLLAGDVYISDALVGVYRIHDGSIGKNVSIDFIMDNVEEKRKISNHLPNSINQANWFYSQASISLNYYLRNSKIIDWKKLLKWSSNLSLKYRWKFYLETFKQRIIYHIHSVKNN
ncbi:glycosyltransferase family 2 protein [Lactococcus garvieae]|uniref:glycosyltransferase family 2 protein n=1 Tax=Lactococcus garvieae TaxID=1363 RepID=UPI003D16F53C